MENKAVKKTGSIIEKNDFIELEFTASVKGGGIFDTNVKEDAEKTGMNVNELKPLFISVGNGMVIRGLDKELEGKEIGKKYSVEIPDEEAFGKRNNELVKMSSLKPFSAQNIIPQKGMQVFLDGMLARILSVSGGRVLVDFNNPLAGKSVIYSFKIKRKVGDENEKINILQDFLFKRRFDFEKKEKEITFKLKKEGKQFEKFIRFMSKPFSDILGLDIKTEIER